MSKLDDLINELCPDGVEYKKIGEVTEIRKGIQFNKENMADEGTYPVINGGINPSGFIEQYNTDENTITVSQGGASAGYVNFITTKFWAGAHCYVIRPLEKVLNRYIFHFIKSQEYKLQECQYGAGIPALSKGTVSDLEIPVPPLEIQNEIVRILDSFTELEEELEEELVARRKQYEYYRDSLLTFDDIVEWKTLGETCKLYAGATPSTTKPEYWENGTIPWMSSGEVNLGQVYKTEKKITQLGFDNCSTKMVPANSIVVALAGQGKTRGTVAITRIELCTNQSLCSMIPNETLDSYYLYFYMKGQYNELRRISSGDGTRGGLNLKMLNEFKIPVPSIEKQKQITDILDRFDALTNDITSGLPAEIEARHKQYEYYRDKLLTFKRKEA